ncbi:MAG: 3-hydroxybutyryl-CoA dehydrogenase [Pseudonocardia sp. SCN 72-86]|nr:MAG: 3-hydroxybutyryl-CoA dehydrogenase [Pseudonocardia sp. SCN 72-86]
MTEIRAVGVVGGGIMGSGIAEVCAIKGLNVTVCEANHSAASASRDRISRSFLHAVQRRKLTDTDADAATSRLTFTTEIDELASSDLVIEAVAENEGAKTDVFRTLDNIVADTDVILATNTSSIPITQIAAVTARPHRVLGIHFFNPVPVMNLVEIIPSVFSDEKLVRRAQFFVESTLGKQPIRAKDQAGFVVNALLVPYLVAAIRMLDDGIATAIDIDCGMTLGCAHPMGPLALADLIGLDTVMAVAESMYDEYRLPQYAPPPLLRRLVEAGILGKKVGQGFHSYVGS